MQHSNPIGARLSSAIPFLTPGGRVIDVGTDHAYLPIHLLQAGISACALACDINQGPIEAARAHIAAAGLEDRIQTRLTDGLHGVADFAPDDVLIFGMGGELIAHILEEAPWVRTPSITLVLQPMSRASLLRHYLAENGFAIIGERLTFEDKYYQTVAARYTGDRYTLNETEAWVGPYNLAHPTELTKGFLRHEIGVFEAIIKGKSRAVSADCSYEINMKQRLEDLL